MRIRADEFQAVCESCEMHIRDVFTLEIGNGPAYISNTYLCFSCIIKLRDLAHEATCEKDVTGLCNCFGVE
jgi:hypothetical protein